MSRGKILSLKRHSDVAQMGPEYLVGILLPFVFLTPHPTVHGFGFEPFPGPLNLGIGHRIQGKTSVLKGHSWRCCPIPSIHRWEDGSPERARDLLQVTQQDCQKQDIQSRAFCGISPFPCWAVPFSEAERRAVQYGLSRRVSPVVSYSAALWQCVVRGRMSLRGVLSGAPAPPALSRGQLPAAVMSTAPPPPTVGSAEPSHVPARLSWPPGAAPVCSRKGDPGTELMMTIIVIITIAAAMTTLQ